MLPYVGAAGIGISAAALRPIVMSREFIFARAYLAYAALLNGYFRDSWLDIRPRRIILGQAAALVGATALTVYGTLPWWWAVLLVLTFGPIFYFRRKVKQRLEALELQIDGFLLAYANTLKTIANPSAALLCVVDVLQDPMRMEIDRMLREIRVGKSLEEALKNMSTRIRSRTLDASLCAVLIGVQVGGDLPEVLTTIAGVIREMQRLEGVIKTKTAEGKSQLWVLGAFPAMLYLLMGYQSPGFYDKMSTTVPGYIMSGVAIIIWMSAIALARKIVDVDI